MDTNVLNGIIAQLDALALEAENHVTGAAGTVAAVRYIRNGCDATKGDLVAALSLDTAEADMLVEACRHRLIETHRYVQALRHKGVVVEEHYLASILTLVGQVLTLSSRWVNWVH